MVTTTVNSYYQPIYDAVRFLSLRDTDRAASLNGIGWNRFDSPIGNRLADRDPSEWTDRELYMAWKITRKYAMTQLGPNGIHVSMLVQPPFPDVERSIPDQGRKIAALTRYGQSFAKIEIDDDASYFLISWGGYDPNWGDRIAMVRDMPGSRFDKESKVWHVPVNIVTIEAVTNMVVDSSEWETPFSYDSHIPAVLDKAMDGMKGQIKASSAAVSSFEVKGLSDSITIRPFQRAGVEFALTNKHVLIADEMGLGKSGQAIASILSADAMPALIVCPASLKINWKVEFEKWSASIPSIQILTGTKGGSILPETKVAIINYDILKAWHDDLLKVGWRAVVLDESHYVKASKAQRSKAAKSIVDNIKPDLCILLTGTPVMNRPVELWSQIEILGYAKKFGGYYQYVNRYCAAVNTGFGLDVSGASNLDELNAYVRSEGIMVRRTKRDVLTELPPKQWATVPVEMEASVSKKYRKAVSNLAEWISQRKADAEERHAEWRAQGHEQGLSGNALADYIAKQRRAYAASEEEVAVRNQQLLRFNVLKQIAYEGKRKAVFDWVDDFLQTEKKLVIFAWHQDAVDELAERYNAPKIKGGMKQEEVQEGKDRFQNDPDCRVIVCNIAAGGVGHTLTAASDVVFVEYAWNPALMDQASDRVHRIGQEAESVTAWQLVAVHPDGDETIDGEMTEIIGRKRGVVDEATDGLGSEAQISMVSELADRLAKQVGGQR